ncbi:TlpA family protein disulfide reductase [Sphingobacterium rhinopitheci]|uniref:TlpA family protein disulfide reductase n=1 Tax=Sphingobacterium rhinopitheci TaxID=2781960 RepID=UPI001F528EE9|nr:thioredoxin-like domain-containing protein [Sphingobacterium rhinopitheci]
MKIYILFFLFFSLFKSYSQDNLSYKIIVTLENSSSKILILHDYTDNRNIFIPGKQIHSFMWEFSVPDSIAIDSEYLELLVDPYNPSKNSTTSVRFVNKTKNKEVKVSNIGFEDRVNHIQAKYIGETIYKGQGLSPSLTKLDSIIYGDWIVHDYEIIKKDTAALSDIEVRAKEPYFGWFSSAGDYSKSYNDFLSSYIELSKRYSDSRYLLMNLANNLNNFKSREDVKLIYENLSNKHSETKWNLRIKNFLKDNFINIKLLNVKTNKYESVIENVHKHNLIIFTASWCMPCIEEIPLLKTLHKDLKEKLEFTYITIDKKATIDHFKKLLYQHEIPWRSLHQGNNYEIVKNYYSVSSIPHVIVISPDNRYEVLDIRKIEDRDKLYNKVSNKTI